MLRVLNILERQVEIFTVTASIHGRFRRRWGHSEIDLFWHLPEAGHISEAEYSMEVSKNHLYGMQGKREGRTWRECGVHNARRICLVGQGSGMYHEEVIGSDKLIRSANTTPCSSALSYGNPNTQRTDKQRLISECCWLAVC
jgi:hypothetical protein